MRRSTSDNKFFLSSAALNLVQIHLNEALRVNVNENAAQNDTTEQTSL